jgi:hypothetical protein
MTMERRLPAVIDRILLSQELKRDRFEMAKYWHDHLRPRFYALLDGYGHDESGLIQTPTFTMEMKLHFDFKEIAAPVKFLLTKVGSLISISCQIPGRKPFAIFTLSPNRELLLDESGEPVNHIGGQFCSDLLDLFSDELHSQASK